LCIGKRLPDDRMPIGAVGRHGDDVVILENDGAYDRIVFEGTSVSLDGDLIDAFMPSQSDTFQIFDFSSLTSGNTGQFNTLTLPSLSDALSWDHSDLYSSGTLFGDPRTRDVDIASCRHITDVQ